jgi:hypothetical protein
MAGIVTRKSAQQLGKALAPPLPPRVLPSITITVTIAQQYPTEPNTSSGGRRNSFLREKALSRHLPPQAYPQPSIHCPASPKSSPQRSLRNKASSSNILRPVPQNAMDIASILRKTYYETAPNKPSASQAAAGRACFLYTTKKSLSQWDVNGSSRWLDLQPG